MLPRLFTWLRCALFGHQYEVQITCYPWYVQLSRGSTAGLTRHTAFSMTESTNDRIHPHTIIITAYQIDADEKATYLYGKKCKRCGKIIPCDPFAMEEYDRRKRETERILNELGYGSSDE